jgi:hypothetical protein
MIPTDMGWEAHKEFGDEAENPFDFAKADEYIKWSGFEKGWQAREKCQKLYERHLTEKSKTDTI